MSDRKKTTFDGSINTTLISVHECKSPILFWVDPKILILKIVISCKKDDIFYRLKQNKVCIFLEI